METFLHDLRHAWRNLAKSPGFALTAVLTLALGIAVNTAIFTVVQGVLLTPLPYGEPERLALVWNRMTATSMPKAPLSAPDYVDLARESRSFAALAATNNVNEVTLTGDDAPPQQVRMANVTANFFDVLRADAATGRTFVAEEGQPIAAGLTPDQVPPGAAVLSHDFWSRHFAADPEIEGRTLLVNGNPLTVVGVMPPAFRLHMPPDAGMPTDIDLWTPFRFDLAQQPRDNQWLRVVGRLAPGVELATARDEMDAMAARFREESTFHQNMGMQIDVNPMHADVVGHVRPVLWALFGAVGFVLLIACANVANLMLARATLRGREMAVRSALGAGRGRILRQVLTEGALLAVLGGVVGVALAQLGLRGLLALRPADLPRLESLDGLALDPTVLAFTVGATVLAALLSALAPAFDLAGVEPRQVLAERGGDGGGGRLRLRSALVVAEIALSLVLLVGAGLMVRSFVSLLHVSPGYDPQGVYTYKVSLPGRDYPQPADRTAFFAEMQRTVGGLPGVEAVGAVYPLPLSGRLWTGPWGLPGESVEDWSRNEANFRATTPGFFEAVGARLLAGRTLERADVDEEREVVVIDERLAAAAFPGRPPVGERLGVDFFGNPRELEVVGVVAHMRHDTLAEDGRATLYFPHHLFPWTQMYVAVRGRGEPAALAAPVRDRVRELDAGVPTYGERTLADYVDEAVAPTRFVMLLLSIFALVALLLALVGLFGVVAYSVRARTRELGIRLALGASGGRVLGLVMRRGLGLVGAGVVAGLLAALALTRVLGSQLHGVTATDPWTFAILAAALAMVAVVASWLPARRALAVDPIESLRAE